MPTYVYRFLDCEGTIDVQQAFTDAALTEAVCPADGLVHPVKKVFTPVGVTFKGNGFYKTDNRGSGSTASAGKDGKSSGDKSSGDGASTKDTSPAKASESSGASDSSSSATPKSSDSSGSSSSTPKSDTKKSHSHGSHSHTH